MPALLTPPETRDITYTYDTRDAVSQTTYTNLGKKTVYARNAAGWLMENRTTNMAGTTTYHHQRLAYDNLSRITEQYWQNEALNRVETYAYDAADRLTTWYRNGIAGTALTGEYVETYAYDATGNRTEKERTSMVGGWGTTTDAYAYANAALYQRANWLTGSARMTGLARTDVNTYTENGGIATRRCSEDVLINTTPYGRQVYETWSYEANNLVERYTRSAVVESQNLGAGCYPDAAAALPDEWRYRYAPFMEREQKRQYGVASGDPQTEGLAWVYYGLGGDKKQLSVWNGVQGSWCLQDNHVFLWPVEYNSYGPMNMRIITRAVTKAKEIVFTDHLGSTVQVRLGAPDNAEEQQTYTSFGEDVDRPDRLRGRTGYIGRETDTESDLGSYGVRQYDAGYGRFLSTDPLWGKYLALTPYQYAGNNPITNYDNNGREILHSDDMSDEEKTLVLAVTEELRKTPTGATVLKRAEELIQPITVSLSRSRVLGQSGEAEADQYFTPLDTPLKKEVLDPETRKIVTLTLIQYDGGVIKLPKSKDMAGLVELYGHELKHQVEAAENLTKWNYLKAKDEKRPEKCNHYDSSCYTERGPYTVQKQIQKEYKEVKAKEAEKKGER